MTIDESKYEIIESDVFFIASRLKEIDLNYAVVRNRKSGALEVHNLSQYGSSYALKVPYDVLDARTIELVRRTSVERYEKLMQEIRADGDAREKAEKESLKKTSEHKREQALKAVGV